MTQIFRPKNLAIIGMLIAVDIILTRFLAIQTAQIRISFGFFAIAMIGMLYGPVVAGVAGGMSDVLGWVLAPHAPFYPGFTVSAVIAGVIFGFFLHRPKISLTAYLLSALSLTLVCDVFLNTLWLSLLQHVPFWSMLFVRSLKIIIMAVLYAAVLPLVCEKIRGLIKARVI